MYSVENRAPMQAPKTPAEESQMVKKTSIVRGYYKKVKVKNGCPKTVQVNMHSARKPTSTKSPRRSK
jgi:hypothetical protein